ncbi:MAG: ATP-binding cassette domain-containing protein [Verrucomicrobiales bacterium]|nr:ATP-binding cassette domain-containing protein [Verrucomicrobiales bacterium]
MDKSVLRTENLSVSAGKKSILNPVSLKIPGDGVFGIIGPSGAGKSTFLKTLNRLCELTPGLQINGQVFHRGVPLYHHGVDVDALRKRVSMIFQQPVVFPTSIFANVIFGVRHTETIPKKDWPDLAERALRQAALWEEVKDRLKKPGKELSIGQQQRLCLARSLATDPEIILMDEPTSALDPGSTEAIESLIHQLKKQQSIILVTHNMRQADKVCDLVAFIGLQDGTGTLLASGSLDELRSRNNIPGFEDYLCCE